MRNETKRSSGGGKPIDEKSNDIRFAKDKRAAFESAAAVFNPFLAPLDRLRFEKQQKFQTNLITPFWFHGTLDFIEKN